MHSTGDFKSRLSKFKKSKPKVVTLSDQELIKTGFLEGTDTMPLLVQPNASDIDLGAWAESNRDFIEEKLLKHGALLFRGFDLRSVNEFESFASSVCPQLYGEYGDLPSEEEGKKVYRSTPYPPDKTILFHNESSHMHRWPTKQFFFCVKAAKERGETPSVDCRKMYDRLDPEIREILEKKNLLYVRNFVDGLDVSWKDFFMTDDRSAVEEYCRRSGTEFEWLENGGLRTLQRCPAVISHPKTGEKSFFNQVELHHVSFLEPDVRDSLISLYGEKGLPRNVYYGDGTTIPDSVMEKIADLYWKTSVQFRWQEGDVLMVDNMLVAHARNPYVGERKIVVAMGEMVDRDSFAQ